MKSAPTLGKSTTVTLVNEEVLIITSITDVHIQVLFSGFYSGIGIVTSHSVPGFHGHMHSIRRT